MNSCSAAKPLFRMNFCPHSSHRKFLLSPHESSISESKFTNWILSLGQQGDRKDFSIFQRNPSHSISLLSSINPNLKSELLGLEPRLLELTVPCFTIKLQLIILIIACHCEFGLSNKA